MEDPSKGVVAAAIAGSNKRDLAAGTGHGCDDPEPVGQVGHQCNTTLLHTINTLC